VLVAVHGPRPPRTARAEDAARAQVDVTVVPAHGQAGAAEGALEEALRRVFEAAIVLEAVPRCVVTLAVHVQADEGGMRAAAVNAATLALMHAGVPMRGMPGAVTVGLLPAACGGEAVLDLLRAEEEEAGAGAAGGRGGGGGGAPDVCATLVYTPAELAEEGGGPLHMSSLGATDAGGVSRLLAAGRAGAAVVLAFTRLAAKRHVLRTAVNFEAAISVTTAELEAMAMGGGAPGAGGGAGAEA
jgi:hypothetical protein